MNAPGRQAMSLFLIDGFADERDMYRMYFETRGAAVTLFEDVETAVQTAAHALPDVIVARSTPTLSSGRELIDKLREHGLSRRVPIVVLTTSILSRDHEAALRAGCASIVVLPALPEAVFAELLRASRARPPSRKARRG